MYPLTKIQKDIEALKTEHEVFKMRLLKLQQYNEHLLDEINKLKSVGKTNFENGKNG